MAARKRLNLTQHLTMLLLPRYEQEYARVFRYEMLMDMEVPQSLREAFWCKYGDELIVSEEALAFTVDNCFVLSEIIGYLTTGRQVKVRDITEP